MSFLSRLLFGRRFPFKLVYSKDYWMLPVGKHVFPVRKYRILYEKLLAMGAGRNTFIPPAPARDEDIRLVHTPKYINKLKTGTLSRSEQVTLELPYSRDLVEFAWLMVGGTIRAAEQALEDGLCVHLGGGFHHAFPDHGEGFCVLHDVAVAVEKLRREGRVRKVMVVDCDVHHGNGTAHIFSRSKDVFTFSIHQMDLYPSEKPASTVDVGLWSNDGDGEYLKGIRAHFPRLLEEFRPELVLYLAGADPFERDQLGSLKVTKGGLEERDRIILGGARKLRIPVVVLLAGGYAPDVEDVVDIHLNTIKVARKVY